MNRQPTPPDRHTPPTVQRLRLRYAKRGRLRFTSHRDFQRALERALRRAGVPMAFSAGFSPHPKISFAGAAPTGAASEAEYAELGLAVAQDPEAVRITLDAALPDGLDVLAMVEAEGPALAERLQASHWQIEAPGAEASALADQERPEGVRYPTGDPAPSGRGSAA
jgi:radical SAM-linked protein